MTEDNVMEFCQWLVSEKGIEAGNLSDYINNNEEEVLKLAEEFKKPKFKIGGKVESAAKMFKCGGKTEEKQDGGKMPRKEFKSKKSDLKDVRSAAKNNFGFNNEQFRIAYKNNKEAYKDIGIGRRASKIQAQRALMGKDVKSPIDKISVNPIISNIDIDSNLASRIAEGPRKVFIESVLPKIVNTNKKVNTNIDFSRIGDMQFEKMPITTSVEDNTIYDLGNIPEVVVNVPSISKINLKDDKIRIPVTRPMNRFLVGYEDGGKVQKGQEGWIAKIKSFFNVNPDSNSYDGVMTGKDPIRPIAPEDYTPYARNLKEAFKYQHQTYRPELRATEADTVFVFGGKKYDRRTPEDFAEQYYLSQYPDIAATMEEKMKAWNDYQKRTGAKYPPMGGFQKNEYK